jgi:hypothetical protein
MTLVLGIGRLRANFGGFLMLEKLCSCDDDEK